MQLSVYLRILRRRTFSIVLSAACGLVGAAFATSQETKVYRTGTQLIVSAAAPGSVGDTTLLPVAAEQAQALAQIARTRPALDAADRAAEVSAGVTAVVALAEEGSPFLNIEVTGNDPVIVAKVANRFVSTLTSVQLQLKQVDPGNRATLSVVQQAPVNLVPVAPRPKRNLAVGLALGLELGIAVAFVRESLDNRFRDSAQIEHITGLPLLGSIPIEIESERLPAHTQPQSARAEAYRRVRTNLQFTDVAHLPKIVLVTSSNPGDGKTSLACNLAVTCALAGERVVIADADLRKPNVAAYFAIAESPGLSTLLSGATSVGIVRLVLDDLLAVIPSGPVPPNPSELLGAARMREVLAQLAVDYDRVIVDGPPVLAVADAVKLASLVSAVLVVVRMDRTTVDDVKRTRTGLELAQARVLGIVANGVTPAFDQAYGYGSYIGSAALAEGTGGGRRGRRRDRSPRSAPSDGPVRLPLDADDQTQTGAAG